jgi:hypothetical protein
VDERSAVWHSIDGDWCVSAVIVADAQYYEVTHRGQSLAELDTFAELARWVPLHLLVAEDQHA